MWGFGGRVLGQDPVQGEAGRKEPVEAVKGGQAAVNGTLNFCRAHSESKEH